MHTLTPRLHAGGAVQIRVRRGKAVGTRGRHARQRGWAWACPGEQSGSQDCGGGRRDRRRRQWSGWQWKQPERPYRFSRGIAGGGGRFGTLATKRTLVTLYSHTWPRPCGGRTEKCAACAACKPSRCSTVLRGSWHFRLCSRFHVSAAGQRSGARRTPYRLMSRDKPNDCKSKRFCIK